MIDNDNCLRAFKLVSGGNKESHMEVVDWNYAIATLVIRFVGIFVVLGILQAIMQITGRIFAHIDLQKKSAEETNGATNLSGTITEDQAAAVGMALYLYDKKHY